MNKSIFVYLSTFCVLVNLCCNSNLNLADRVVQQAIDAHGGEGYDSLDLNFRFRDRMYDVWRRGGVFKYQRTFVDSLGQTLVDVLSNDGFVRTIDSESYTLTEKELTAYSNALNSVVYFALLPHGLNDGAVIKQYIKQTEIDGVNYHEILIRFNEEGGGTDFEDEFLYWINTENYFIDYLAYSFHVNDGGVRFRKAYNRRKAGNIYLQDYINYKPSSPETPLDSVLSLFKSNQLEKLSEINLIEGD